MNLPLEVLNNVLQSLPKKDLKHLRLVCVSLIDKVAPFLFDSVFISLDPLDLEKAGLVLETFASTIKTVIISPVAYKKLTRQEYRVRVFALKSVVRCPPRSRFDEHIKRGYREYCTVQERTSQSDSHSRILHMFGAVLARAPCLKKVIITHRHRNTSLTGQELVKYCRYKTCSMPAEMHEMFRVGPLLSQDILYSPTLNTVIYMALTASGPKMAELVLEHHRVLFPFSAAIDSFLLYEELLPRSFTSLSKITRLRLHVDQTQGRSPVLFRTGIVAQQLFNAVNLQHLYLGAVRYNDDWRFAVPSESIFYYLLNGCRFRKLQTFVLDGCEMQGDELLPFLRASPDLKDLVLWDLSLADYTWKDLIASIKADTRLRVLIMDSLTNGGLETEHLNHPALRPKLPCYVDCADDIAKYYFGDGPNPFADDTLERYIEKWFPANFEHFPLGKGMEYMAAWC